MIQQAGRRQTRKLRTQASRSLCQTIKGCAFTTTLARCTAASPGFERESARIHFPAQRTAELDEKG
jgi:hypothetical protein